MEISAFKKPEANPFRKEEAERKKLQDTSLVNYANSTELENAYLKLEDQLNKIIDFSDEKNETSKD